MMKYIRDTYDGPDTMGIFNYTDVKECILRSLSVYCRLR